MKSLQGIGLREVQAVYGGPERRLWELLMGEQIHIGGLEASRDLARRAGIASGTRGIDLCCCTGAGMRFLARLCGVARMTGVDATALMIDLGRERCREEGLTERIEFILADACETGLPGGRADFVWGEDAWCYVVDKPALIAEARRLVRPGGAIAFSDWIEGRAGLSAEAGERFLRFMKFPNLATLEEYRRLLEGVGCVVEIALETGRFAPAMDLYLAMLERQLTFDALKIVGFDPATLETLTAELHFIRQLAHDGRIAQALLVARRAD